MCTPGDWYTLPNEPCKDCVCGSDGKPTTECREMACDMDACPAGQWGKPIPGTCCGQECVPEGLFISTNLGLYSYSQFSFVRLYW